MSDAGELTGEERGRDDGAPRPGSRRVLIGVAVFVAGLYLTLKAAARLIYEAERYDPLAADCDQCGLTLLLDNIGWLILAVGSYLLLAGLVWWALRRAGGRHHAEQRPRIPRSAP